MQIFKRVTVAVAILVVLTGSLGLDDGTHRKQVNRSLIHQGNERSYVVYEPGGTYKHKSYPLIIALHGGGGSARSMLRLTQGRFNEIAEEEGALVVYPEGLRRFWNEGRKKPVSFSHRNNIDDVGFIKAMVEALQEEYSIDAARIFVTGISNGGLMAYRLACELPDMIAGVASVTASFPEDVLPECQSVEGISLLMMNGTDDPLLPYDGGMIVAYGIERGKVISTEATIEHWLKQNECGLHSEKDLLPDTAQRDQTTVTRYNYTGCDSGVKIELYRIEGGGHTWPGGRQYLREDRIGKTSRDINACNEIWKFFKRIGD